jgi:purine-nucleoside/S-methyl-5'-thioadenosine phosphorylase / adenosine deaminase
MEGNMKKDLVMGTSTVVDGNMSVNWGSEDEVINNRKKFLKKLGLSYSECVMASLMRGTGIRVTDSHDRGKYPECDCLITAQTGLPLMMVTADCFPVVLYEPAEKLLALVHLGYQGTDGRLAEKAVRRLLKMGAECSRLEVFIGPGVRKESYRWKGGEVNQSGDKNWQAFLEIKNGFTHVDIPEYIKKQLADGGIKPENITDSMIDTGRDRNYFSHYRAKRTGEPEGRFATVVMMKPY